MKTTKLLNGKVESAIVEPEPTKKVVVRLMKVISITRTPEGRVAHIQLSPCRRWTSAFILTRGQPERLRRSLTTPSLWLWVCGQCFPPASTTRRRRGRLVTQRR